MDDARPDFRDEYEYTPHSMEKVTAWFSNANVDTQKDPAAATHATSHRRDRAYDGADRLVYPNEVSGMDLRGMADASVEDASPRVGVSSPVPDAQEWSRDYRQKMPRRPAAALHTPEADKRPKRTQQPSSPKKPDLSQMRHTRSRVSEPQLTPMMSRVVNQFSRTNLDDHRCIGKARSICMGGAVRHHVNSNGDGPHRAAYALYFGPGHPDNFAAALSEPEYAPGFLQRRRAPSPVTLLRRAELWSIVAILRYAMNVLPPLSCAHVCIDSTYITKAWSVWIPHWEKNGWPGESENSPRSPNLRRRGDSDNASIASAVDDTLSVTSSATRRSRRLINEDLLRELARLHQLCAELEMRGDICVHLYLIDRAHNPAEQMARGLASFEAQLPLPVDSALLQVKEQPKYARSGGSTTPDASSEMFDESPQPVRTMRKYTSEPSLNRKAAGGVAPNSRFAKHAPDSQEPEISPTKSSKSSATERAARLGDSDRHTSPQTTTPQKVTMVPQVSPQPAVAPPLVSSPQKAVSPPTASPEMNGKRSVSRASARSEAGSPLIDRLVPRFLRRKVGSAKSSPAASPEQGTAPLPPMASLTQSTTGTPDVPSMPTLTVTGSPLVGTAVVGSPHAASPSLRNIEAGLFSPGGAQSIPATSPQLSPPPTAAPAIPVELYSSAASSLGQKSDASSDMFASQSDSTASGLGIIVDRPPLPKRNTLRFQTTSPSVSNGADTRQRRTVRGSASQPSLRAMRDSQSHARTRPVQIEVEDEASLMSSRLRATAKAVARAEQEASGRPRRARAPRGHLLDTVESVPTSARTYASHPRPSGRKSWKMRSLAGDDSSDNDSASRGGMPQTPTRVRGGHDVNAMDVSPYSMTDSEDAGFTRRNRY